MAGRKDNVWAAIGRYTSLAFILPVSTLVGYAIGYGLDKVFHTNFLFLVFLLLGIAAGFVEVIRGLTKQDGA